MSTGRIQPPAVPLSPDEYNRSNEDQFRNVLRLYFNRLANNTTPDFTYIDFPFTPANPAWTEGRLFYDYTDHSLAYYNDAEQVTVNIGREMLVRAYNNSGATIMDGDIVYINSSHDGWPTILKVQANQAVSFSGTLGMVTDPIANGEYGYVTVSGVVHDVDTSAYSAGQQLFLSATTMGGWTGVAPLQPDFVISIGYVLNVGTTDGSVFVRIQRSPWAPNLEIRDTSASITLPTTPTVFKPSTLVRGDGFTYDNTTGVITFGWSASYAISILFNAEPSASNKNIYFYVEEDMGAGWQIAQYSARQITLQNATQTQVTISAARYYPMNTRIRFYIWGDSTVYLKTADLPGTTPGTVTLPAYRCLMAG